MPRTWLRPVMVIGLSQITMKGSSGIFRINIIVYWGKDFAIVVYIIYAVFTVVSVVSRPHICLGYIFSNVPKRSNPKRIMLSNLDKHWLRWTLHILMFATTIQTEWWTLILSKAFLKHSMFNALLLSSSQVSIFLITWEEPGKMCSRVQHWSKFCITSLLLEFGRQI